MKTVPRIIVQLVHIHGPLMGTIQEFREPAIDIGRHPSCHLSFPRELAVISRRHASIKREGNRFEIIDTSTNGTYLNGQRVSRGFLKDGDVLMFTEGGPKVSFLTRMEEGSPPLEVGVSPQPVGAVSGNGGVQVSPPAPASAPPPPSAPAPPPVSPPPPAAPPPGQVEGVAVEVVMAPLVIQYGPMLQSFKEVPVTVGSGTDCEVVLEHPMLVARHAQFFFSGGSYWIKDLTGKSQVRINTLPIETAAPLNPQDRLDLTPQGPTFRFLAGGRLAEIVEPRADMAPPAPPEKEPEPEKPRSLFKRLFK